MEDKRFLKEIKKNIPACVGLFLILFFAVIGLLGYWIMPDNTPLANDRIPELRKLAPGTKVDLLLTKKNREIPQNSFFKKYIYGQTSSYIAKPLKSYEISKDHRLLIITPFGLQKSETIKIEDIVTDPSLGIEEKVTRLHKRHIIQRKYWLGTDQAGRDILSMLIYGARISLLVGLTAVSISLIIGILLGGVSGYYKGWIDSVIMWFISVIWSVPGILLVIGISLALQSKGIWVAFLAVGATMWVEVARVVRGQVLEVREKQYVTAAKALGYDNMRIIFKHILPNILGPIIVIATANFATAILVEAGLSFLGLGAQPPTPSWGQMVREGYQLMGNSNSWHILTFPCICISILVLSFNLVGNALRDFNEPKSL